MTVFEDLIGELKDANLLEETVISIDGETLPLNGSMDVDDFDDEFDHVLDSIRESGDRHDGDFAVDPAQQIKELVEKINTYQIVEHILGSVETTVSGRVNDGFDAFEAKTALHTAQMSSSDPDSPEFQEAISDLRTQVALWQNSLSARDESVSVSAMRRYCETCQPVLSPQALFALARFSRGMSFSENSRRKYEFIVTRLFSRPAEGHKRVAICSHEEMLGHLRSRFSDSFESYSHLYSGPVDIAPLVTALEDLTSRAQGQVDLEGWINSDFFNRVNEVKQAAGEQFFVSSVTAAAITCNIAMLNKLVELINDERRSADQSLLVQKYSEMSEIISCAIGRTFDVGDVIRDEEAGEPGIAEEEIHISPPPDRIDRELVERKRQAATAAPKRVEKEKGFFSGVGQANKTLLAVTILVVLVSVGFYFWADRYSESTDGTAKAQKVDVVNTAFKDLVREGRISSETFYAITLPAWDNLSREQQEDAIKKMFDFYSQQGCKKVNLINGKGQRVGLASADKVQIFRP